MEDKPPENFREKDQRDFEEQVSGKARRKLRDRKKGGDTIWSGLGLFGIVGWSVAIPTLIGLAIGIWIDSRWPGRFSWTITLMVGGLILGCFLAYSWVKAEQRNIEREAGKNGNNGEDRNHE